MAPRPGDAPHPPPTVAEHKDYLEVVAHPATSADDVLRQAEQVLQICISRKPSRLFVDLTPVVGKFTTLERYDLGMIASRLSPHVGRVAVLVTPQVLDPEQFAAKVARNRGLHIENFTDRAEALAWLLAP